MNFVDALRILRRKGKIRRQKWKPGAHLIMENGQFIFICVGGERHYSFDVDMLEATDWEVYKEEDNWSIKEKLLAWSIIEGDTSKIQIIGYTKEQLIILKEKILKDFKDEMIKNTLHCANLYSKEEIKKILDKRFGF
jgi:hypothetical protein